MAITAFPLKRKFTENFNVYGLIPPTDFQTSARTKFLGWFATIALYVFGITLALQLILTIMTLVVLLLGLGAEIHLTTYQWMMSHT